MRLGVAIDFDGVIASDAKAKSIWLSGRRGIYVPPQVMNRSDLLRFVDWETYEEMQNIFGFGQTLAAEPVQGCFEGLRKIAETFSIVIVTSRTPVRMKWVATWLESNGASGLVDDIVCASEIPKLKMANALGCVALVDNDERHLRGFPEIAVRRILYREGRPFDAADPIDVAVDWRDLLGKLGLERVGVGR